MHKNSKIYVAGHGGLVGSAIVKSLQEKGYQHILGRTRRELDLTSQQAVNDFFSREQPEYVFLAAARVGGIGANATYRADFIYENLMIASNVIQAAYQNKVKKLLFLGSTCIYPKEASQPIKENSLLTGPLEYTNEPYAIAKIAGMKLCESYNLQYGTNFLSVMPTNLYGPRDNFDLATSHVLPAMLRKIYLAKCLYEGDEAAIRADLNKRPLKKTAGTATFDTIQQTLADYGIQKTSISLWGTGKPLREFMWSEDMADGCVFVMEQVDFEDVKPLGGEVRNTHINLGTGKEHSIAAVASAIAAKINYRGQITFDNSKPDGTMRKLTDVSKIHALGWKHQIDLEVGLDIFYTWYLNH